MIYIILYRERSHDSLRGFYCLCIRLPGVQCCSVRSTWRSLTNSQDVGRPVCVSPFPSQRNNSNSHLPSQHSPPACTSPSCTSTHSTFSLSLSRFPLSLKYHEPFDLRFAKLGTPAKSWRKWREEGWGAVVSQLGPCCRALKSLTILKCLLFRWCKAIAKWWCIESAVICRCGTLIAEFKCVVSKKLYVEWKYIPLEFVKFAFP